jgi:GTP diphosphokinase / guanosine-3',5'-bis(diphosphate) 3'-diphosphatase
MKALTDAILFAARAHSGQSRKDNRTPYINHPLEVMHLLLHEAEITDTEILMAAVLHDVIEDTAITGTEIEERFGKRVAVIVLELTDDKMLSKENRKRQQLEGIDLLSWEAKLIRIGDKICNVHDMLYRPPGEWSLERRRDYVEWAEAVVKKMPEVNQVLQKRFYELIKAAEKQLAD